MKCNESVAIKMNVWKQRNAFVLLHVFTGLQAFFSLYAYIGLPYDYFSHIISTIDADVCVCTEQSGVVTDKKM